MKDSPGVDAIERVVEERQIFSVPDGHCARETFQLESRTHQFDRMGSEVYSRYPRARPPELDQIRPQAHTDFKHTLSRGAAEVSESGYEGLELVAPALNLSEVPLGALGSGSVFCTTWLALPE
jgi:hypothetical protein